MRRTFAFVVLLVACGHDAPTLSLVDASGPDAPLCNLASSTCNPIEQTGCNDDEQCTWLRGHEHPDHGVVGCMLAGSDPVGSACAYIAGACLDHDTCVPGAVCASGVCRQICDYNGGTTTCPEAQKCSSDAMVFQADGVTLAGVCR